MCFLYSDVHSFKGSVFHQPAGFCISYIIIQHNHVIQDTLLCMKDYYRKFLWTGLSQSVKWLVKEWMTKVWLLKGTWILVFATRHRSAQFLVQLVLHPTLDWSWSVLISIWYCNTQTSSWANLVYWCCDTEWLCDWLSVLSSWY